MAKYKKYTISNKKDIGQIIISGAFLVVGILFLVLGFKGEIATWLANFGIVALVIAIPLLLQILLKIFNNKMKDM